MKNLKDYTEDLYKCSRCGLCQSVCPVYKATLNECAVSKGKFNILNGVLKGDLNLSKKVKKYLDLCTGCNACKDFCPSGIDARRIFFAAKQEYHRSCELSFFEKLCSSGFVFKAALLAANIFSKLYFLFGIHYVLRLFKPVFRKSGLFGKRILLVDSLFFNRFRFVPKTTNRNCSTFQKTVLFFDGCFNKFINSENKNAVFCLLKDIGVNITKCDFDCCGVSFLNDGNIKAFKNLAHKNLKKISSSVDFVITDCASCNDVLNNYREYVDSSYLDIAENLQQKTVSVLQFLENYSYELVSQMNVKVAIHVPCHENVDIVRFVKNIKGLEYVEAVDYDKCCGFSGTFAIKNPDISRKISFAKAKNYIDSNVDFVLTTCPACLLGLEQGFNEIDCEKRPVVMSLFVFLAKYCRLVS